MLGLGLELELGLELGLDHVVMQSALHLIGINPRNTLLSSFIQAQQNLILIFSKSFVITSK